MSASRQFRFGYVVQISSLLTLAMVNIGLPNWIGAQTFARLNEATAFVGMTCMLFNEGVALLIIRSIQRAGENSRLARNITLQACFEHALIALLALALVAAGTVLVAPGHAYGAADWLLVGLTNLIIASYVCMTAWLVACLKNHVVAALAMAQGLLSFALPLAAVHLGWDVRWAIGGSYLAGLLFCISLLRATDAGTWRPSLARDDRVSLVAALPAASAQTAMRTAIVWLPVLVLAGLGEPTASAAYKIGLALALGVCALVPYHRQTMLSLDGRDGAAMHQQLAAGALLLASMGALALSIFSGPLTALLYGKELAMIADLLPALASFIVLQVLTDVILVHLMARHADRTVLWACGLAIATACLAAALVSPRWLPSLTLGTFVTVALIRQRLLAALALPLRAAALGLLVALAAVAMPAPWGHLAATALLIGALGLDRALRDAWLSTLQRLLRSGA